MAELSTELLRLLIRSTTAREPTACRGSEARACARPGRRRESPRRGRGRVARPRAWGGAPRRQAGSRWRIRRRGRAPSDPAAPTRSAVEARSCPGRPAATWPSRGTRLPVLLAGPGALDAGERVADRRREVLEGELPAVLGRVTVTRRWSVVPAVQREVGEGDVAADEQADEASTGRDRAAAGVGVGRARLRQATEHLSIARWRPSVVSVSRAEEGRRSSSGSPSPCPRSRRS